VQGFVDFRLAAIQCLVAFALLGQIDDHLVGIGAGNVADALDNAPAQPFVRQSLAKLVDGRHARKAHVNRSAALEVDAVVQALANPGERTDEQ
jgi:hypothetical protein